MKKRYLAELVRHVVKEVMTSLDSSMTNPMDVNAAMASADAVTAPTASADAAARAKSEREMRKTTQLKLRSLQKAEKLDKDKNRAETKQWKIKQKAYRKQTSDLKRNL